jgi:hypothetical protein
MTTTLEVLRTGPLALVEVGAVVDHVDGHFFTVREIVLQSGRRSGDGVM